MSIAMFAAMSGLNNFQRMLDVVAGNISNVNTPGYKAARINFEDIYSQTLRSASAPSANLGGTNPMQIGLGSRVGSIETLDKQGTLESTGSQSDFAITGAGFFMLQDGGRAAYTRNGHFMLDMDGSLVEASGRKVLGWMADKGVVNNSTQVTPLTIPTGQSMAARGTSNVRFGGNLDGSATTYNPGPPPTGGIAYAESTIYDSLGQDYKVTMQFTRQATPPGTAGAWNWTATMGGATIGTGTAVFEADGSYDPMNSTPNPLWSFTPTNGAATVNVTPNLTQLSQLVSPTSPVLTLEQDGFPAGTLQTYAIDTRGVITGTYSNGYIEKLGQMALAYFTNVSGLERGENGMRSETPNSGKPRVGEPGTGPRGLLSPSTLEMSNVDLATEFSRMIIAQRAFQANSRVITTTDEMLSELANLKR